MTIKMEKKNSMLYSSFFNFNLPLLDYHKLKLLHAHEQKLSTSSSTSDL